jgi:hypothetical protein
VIDLRLQFAAKNWQPSGSATATGYGLYYAGSERLRAWTSWIHLGVGLILPMGLVDSCRARKKDAAFCSGSETSSFASQDRRLQDGEFPVALL